MPFLLPSSFFTHGERRVSLLVAAGLGSISLAAASVAFQARRRRRAQVDFDEVLDRSEFLTEKHDLKTVLFEAEEGAIAMWVADMDFPICPKIHEAIKERAAHPSFGYTIQPERLWRAVSRWFDNHHGWSIDISALVWSPTVILAASLCVRAFTDVSDSVMVLTPLYPPLQAMVEGAGRRLVRHELPARDMQNDGFAYDLDLELLAQRLREEHVRLLVFCSPHNPGSRVWKRHELEELVKVCREQKVLILSDEIHCDWCLFGHKHVPLGLVAAADQVVTLSGPGKTFGIPGLQGSFLIIADETLRKRYLAVAEPTLCNEGSVFATVGMMAAYEGGAEWLQQAKSYVEGNVLEVLSFLEERVPEVRAWRPQATILMWLDFSSLQLTSQELQKMLLDAGLVLSAGVNFGQQAGQYQRLNVACSRKVLRTALVRLEIAVRGRDNHGPWSASDH